MRVSIAMDTLISLQDKADAERALLDGFFY